MKFQFWKSFFHLSCSLLLAIANPLRCHAQINPLSASISTESIANIRIAVQESSINGDFQFRTLTPEGDIKLPKKGESISIKFGLRITNNSLSEKFFVPNQVDANFFDGSQQLMSPLDGYSLPNTACTYLGRVFISRGSFQSLKPGESVDFFDKAVLSRKHGKVTIQYYTSSGLLCTYGEFKTGKYSVLMTYRSVPRKTVDAFIQEPDREKVWIDEVKSIPGVISFSEDI
jgi:hypothetical protein